MVASIPNINPETVPTTANSAVFPFFKSKNKTK